MHVCPSEQISPVVNEFHEAYHKAMAQSAFLGPMSLAIEKVVKDCFCAIVHTVQAARALSPEPVQGATGTGSKKPTRERVIAHNEATHRHQWDQLIHTVVTACAQVDVLYA